jgi:regulatory protein
MVSVVRAEDSSSASVNLQLSIQKTEWASTGILKVYPEEGPSFFVRIEYLNEALVSFFSEHTLISHAIRLSLEMTNDLLFAARVFLTERAALEYLSRAEQSRYQLGLKLRAKGYLVAEINLSLDYLESKALLDDTRYAGAWLRNHSIHQCEGRKKMLSGLLSRGVDGRVACSAVEDFFSSIDESEFCRKAVEKLIRIGKKEEKLEMALIRKGFSRKMIVDCLKKKKFDDIVE